MDKVEKKLSIAENEWKAVVDRLAKLEESQSSVLSRPKKTSEHIVSVSMWNDRPVVGWDNVKGVGNISDLFIELYVLSPEGNTEKVRVNYFDFLNNMPVAQAKVVSQEVKENIVSDMYHGGGGTVMKRDESTDRPTGESIDLEVVTREVKAEIEFVTGPMLGQKIKVDTKYLNAKK